MRKVAPRYIARALQGYEPSEVQKAMIDPEDISIDPEELVDDLEDAILGAAAAGADDVAALIGVNLTGPPAGALNYARRRAALLVGMKRLEDGSLIPNPVQKWNIAETIRAAINAKVSEAIESGWSPQDLTRELSSLFDASRAETIARAETGFAYNAGSVAIYTDSGQEAIEVIDGDGCLPYGHDDSAGPPSRTPGLIEEEKLANGQIWYVDDIGMDELLGHPRCVRYFVPYDMPASSEGDEEDGS